MNTLSYKTLSLKKGDLIPQRNWLVVDVAGKPLGRAASQIAKLLQGKHKPNYTPHMLCGDYVIVLNAEKVVLTGKKWKQKIYKRHTGYPGGERFRTAREQWERDPRRLIELAVKRMLPKNKLGRRMLRQLLKVYVGSEHPHQAQQPEKRELKI